MRLAADLRESRPSTSRQSARRQILALRALANVAVRHDRAPPPLAALPATPFDATRSETKSHATSRLSSTTQSRTGLRSLAGTRMTVHSALGRVEHGETVDEILDDNPDLFREAVEAGIIYARAHLLIGGAPVEVGGQCYVKLFINKYVSPQLAARLNATGRYDAVPRLHIGRRGEPDHRVVEWCMPKSGSSLPKNARDFRRLIGGSQLHPGRIILLALDREGTWRALQAVLAFLEGRGRPSAKLVNHVIEMDDAGGMTLLALPPPPAEPKGKG